MSLQPSNERTDRDVQWWNRLRAGESGVLDDIVRTYWTPLVAFVDHLVHDQDVAEDIVQEVLARLWERRGAWKANGSIEALLFRMARNAAIDSSRTQRRRTAILRLVTARAGGRVDPDASERAELARVIDAAIRKLPVARREVLLLVRMTSMSHAAVAATLDIAPQTVANHMRLALADLRAAVEPYVSEGTIQRPAPSDQLPASASRDQSAGR